MNQQEIEILIFDWINEMEESVMSESHDFETIDAYEMYGCSSETLKLRSACSWLEITETDKPILTFAVFMEQQNKPWAKSSSQSEWLDNLSRYFRKLDYRLPLPADTNFNELSHTFANEDIYNYFQLLYTINGHWEMNRELSEEIMPLEIALSTIEHYSEVEDEDSCEYYEDKGYASSKEEIEEICDRIIAKLERQFELESQDEIEYERMKEEIEWYHYNNFDSYCHKHYGGHSTEKGVDKTHDLLRKRWLQVSGLLVTPKLTRLKELMGWI